jgi:hemerythrin superfamily protein
MPNRMDSILSTGAGVVKRFKARLAGLTGVWRTLAEEHGAVMVLMERAKASDEKFTALWPTIKRELVSHETAEVREVFPTLRTSPITRSLADHHDAEANTLEHLVKKIDELAIGAQERRDTFQTLISTVGRHATEEENEIFPKAQEAFGKEVAERLDASFKATKKRVAEAV